RHARNRGGKKPLSSILIGSRESRQPETHCDRKIFDFRSCRSQNTEYKSPKPAPNPNAAHRTPNPEPSNPIPRPWPRLSTTNVGAIDRVRGASARILTPPGNQANVLSPK